MSALGEYIHYYKRNYYSYGVNRTDGIRTPGRTDFNRIITDKRRIMKESIQIAYKDKFKEEYQETLNYLYGSSMLQGEQLAQESEKEIKEEFYKLIKEKFPNVIIDYATMSVASKDIESIGGLTKINSEDKRLSFGTIEKKILQLKKIFQQENLKGQYTKQELFEKQKLLNKVIDTEQRLYEQALERKSWNKMYINMRNVRQSKGWGINLTKANKKQRTFIQDLNELITFVNGVKKSNINGILGELSAAVAGAKMTGVAVKNLREYLTDAVMGKASSYGQYLKINFSDEFVDIEKLATKGWSYNTKDGNVTVTKPTQDKVDVKIITPEGIKTLSVKNYNFRKGNAQISLVTGMSLLTIMQNENQDDFINHYLNITSSRNGEKNLHYVAAARMQMHQLMRDIILVNALTGLNISKTMKGGKKPGREQTVADYFVINDNSQPGKFKIYSMSELLDFSSFSHLAGLSKYVTVNGYDDPEWVNEGPDARTRITNLIMQTHRMKLHAFASSKFFYQHNT